MLAGCKRNGVPCQQENCAQRPCSQELHVNDSNTMSIIIHDCFLNNAGSTSTLSSKLRTLGLLKASTPKPTSVEMISERRVKNYL